VLQDVLQPVNASVRSTAISISNFLQNKPNLDFAIPGNHGAQSWLLTTYLDDVSIYKGFLACMCAAWANNPVGNLVTIMNAYRAESDSDSITCLCYRCISCQLVLCSTELLFLSAFCCVHLSAHLDFSRLVHAQVNAMETCIVTCVTDGMMPPVAGPSSFQRGQWSCFCFG